MKFQARLFSIFLSLLVILSVFLLTTQPAFASVAHIVRLKYEDDSPVVGAKVILHTQQQQGCEDSDPWCNDCDWWKEGPSWLGTSDIYGIVVFKMTDQSSEKEEDDTFTPTIDEDYKIQRCSCGYTRPAMMAVVYLDQYSGGYWRFDQLSPAAGIYPHAYWDGFQYVMKDVASDDVGWFWDVIKSNAQIDPYCDEGCAYFNSDGFTKFHSWGGRGNVVKANIDSSDGDGAKNGNFYWEWTWVENSTAQNTKTQPLLAFAGNLWASILNIFPKKLI